MEACGPLGQSPSDSKALLFLKKISFSGKLNCFIIFQTLINTANSVTTSLLALY